MKDSAIGIEIDRPEHALAADLLVEQDGEEQAERQADADVEKAEDAHIGDRGVPARWRVAVEGPAPQPLIGARAGERIGREGLGVGEGQIDRPQDEAVDEDE